MEHFYEGILPDYFDYPDLYSMVVKEAIDGGKFVEVGCLYGRSSCYLGVEIVNSGKHISVDFIDPWFQYDEKREYLDKIRDRDAYMTFLRNIDLVKGLQQRTIRLESDEACNMYDDASLDFVFIDGDHSEDAVRKDLAAWFSKVKPGGIFAGHDFYFPGVNKAVNEFFASRGMEGRVQGIGNSWMVRIE